MKKIAAASMVCMLFLSGCASTGQYDVLDKVVTRTVGESIAQKVEKEINKESLNIEHFLRSISSDSTEDNANTKPKYDPLEYIDVSNCDISKIEIPDLGPVTDEDVIEEIHGQMIAKDIFDNRNISQDGDIVSIDYIVTENGLDKPYIDIKQEDRIIGKNMFPDKINKKLIGVKAGDEINMEYEYPADYVDSTYRGKTFNYHIVINKVKGMTITDEVAAKLSETDSMSANTYIKFNKIMMKQRRDEEIAEKLVNEMCKLCIVKSVPADATASLEREMKVLALASKYGVLDENLDYEQVEKALGKELKNERQEKFAAEQS